MQTNKKTMLAAALAVAVVALAGVGYATNPAHWAETENSGNSLNSTYLEISQTGGDNTYATGSILTSLYFNTKNASSGVFKYFPVADYGRSGGVFSTAIETKEYALISSALTLTLNKVNETADTATISITASDFSAIAGLEYWFVLDPSATGIADTYATKDVTAGVWTISNVPLFNEDDGAETGSITYDVYIFVKLDSDHATAGVSPGENQSMSTAGFNNPTTFTFKATVNAVA